MKKCLECEKEYEAKRPTSKFCSDNCRVKYHRNHKTKAVIGKVQLDVLYDKILALVSDKNFQIKSTPVEEIHSSYFGTPKRKLIRSFTQYQKMKLDCINEDEWFSLAEEIRNDETLSDKQINLLLN